jgi:hypothetical protein
MNLVYLVYIPGTDVGLNVCGRNGLMDGVEQHPRGARKLQGNMYTFGRNRDRT